MRALFLQANIRSITFASASGTPSYGLEVPADLKELGNALNQAGFKVLFEQPPRKDSYGLVNTRRKTIWIAPITVEMGISEQHIYMKLSTPHNLAPQVNSRQLVGI